MAKVFTNDEKREIEEKAKYILTAMDDIGCKPVSSIRRGIICMPNGRGTMR